MNALVTGGAGFIGSHLTEALLADGHHVTVIDDLSTGQSGNLAAVAGAPRLRTHWMSIMDDDRVLGLVDEADVVFHLAAAVGVRLVLEQQLDTIETNVLGTARILRHARKAGRTVVIASTSEVYGKSDRIPLREDDDAILGSTAKARWSYACGKALDEFLALAYSREAGVPTIIVRYFNVIGPRQRGRYGMVVPRFVEQALTGEPITVYGDGEQSRSFTGVADAVRATIALSRRPSALGQVFNIGNGAEVTINELAARVKALTGSASEIVHVPYTQAFDDGFEEIRRRVPDITKLQRAVGYRPAVSLDAALTSIIDHVRAQR